MAAVAKELERREREFNPATYGLPDLLRDPLPTESPEEFETARRNELFNFIQNRMYGVKDGKKFKIRLIKEQKRFLGDLFFRKYQKACCWKSRGGGGSLSVAILIWLSMVYHKISFLDLGGSADQSRYIYEYTKTFWGVFPDLANFLLDSEPLMSLTKLKTGVTLKIGPATEKQARGSHVPGLVCDEANQEYIVTDKAFRAALQGPMSEENHMIVILSTFQHPEGFFKEIWDDAELMGYQRYKWNVFEAMEKCEEGLETATDDDKLALKYCKEECLLTEEEPIYDQLGNVLDHRWIGCNGVARHSSGFYTKSQVEQIKKLNYGTEIFNIEFCCQRPGWERAVFELQQIDDAVCQEFFYWPHQSECAVGIDWGIAGTTSVVLAVRGQVKVSPKPGVELRDDCIGIVENKYFVAKMTRHVINFLMDLRRDYGSFIVYGDASSHGGIYNNMELMDAGFEVQGVDFGRWKEFGITNLARYFAFRKLKILEEHQILISQFKKLRRDGSGKIIKSQDHGPDSTLACMLNFVYSDTYGDALAKDEQVFKQSTLIGGGSKENKHAQQELCGWHELRKRTL